jgi:hypothetical protein
MRNEHQETLQTVRVESEQVPITLMFFRALVAGISLLGLLAIWNVAIDPYLLYGSPRLEGFNAYKTRFFFGQFQAKPRLLQETTPHHLVLGTSTAGGSLRPDHPGFRGQPAFNYALAGSPPAVQARALDEALQLGTVRSIIVCVDLFAYNAFLDQPLFRRWGRRESARDDPFEHWAFIRQDMESEIARLFQWSTLKDSVGTFLDQRQPGAGGAFRDLRDDGFWQNPRPVALTQLHMFQMVERQYLATGWFPDPQRRFGFDDGLGRSTVGELRELLLAARRADVDVLVAVMPFHARYAEAMHEAGLWDDLDALKRSLVGLAADPEMKGGVRVWDFSGYHALSMDRVNGAATDTPWFEDAIHPSVATGDRMLRRMLEEPLGESEFGRLLEPATLEASLAAAVSRRPDYQAANPADVEDVRAVAQQTAHARLPRLPEN